jgi:hypothetical protein
MKFMPETEGNNSEPDTNLRNKNGLLIIDNLFHYSGALTMLMVVASIIAALDIFLMMIGLIYAVYLLTIMFKIIQSARSLDKAMENRTGVNGDSDNSSGRGNSAIDDND